MSFHLTYNDEVRVPRPQSQQRFVGLTELKEYGAVRKLGDLCSLHFFPKGEWRKVGEITCYLSFFKYSFHHSMKVPEGILSSSLTHYQVILSSFFALL